MNNITIINEFCMMAYECSVEDKFLYFTQIQVTLLWDVYILEDLAWTASLSECCQVWPALRLTSLGPSSPSPPLPPSLPLTPKLATCIDSSRENLRKDWCEVWGQITSVFGIWALKSGIGRWVIATVRTATREEPTVSVDANCHFGMSHDDHFLKMDVSYVETSNNWK